jgi:hypothetical protein
MLVSPRDEGWRHAVIVIPALSDPVDRDETSQPIAPGGAQPWVRFGNLLADFELTLGLAGCSACAEISRELLVEQPGTCPAVSAGG